MKNRDLVVVFFLIAGITCVIGGILSMYVDILSSWRYSVLCYVFFVLFVALGYMIFSDNSWYIAPVKGSSPKIASVSVASKQSATIKQNPVNTKSSVTGKIEKSKINRQKARKGTKK